LNSKISSLSNSRKLKELGLTNRDNLFEVIQPFDKPLSLTLNDYWLIGFVEAEGCFHVSFSKTKNTFKFIFDLTQKGEDNKEYILDKLVKLFGVGAVYKHSKKGIWSFRVGGITANKVIIDYFYQFSYSFLTIK
jgi:hypothetical protein